MSAIDFMLNSQPGETWKVTAACPEHKHLEFEGIPFTRQPGAIQPCMSGCVYERQVAPAPLLPCPFCGRDAVCYRSDPDVEWYATGCQTCGASIGSCTTRELAIRKWNQRDAAGSTQPAAPPQNGE